MTFQNRFKIQVQAHNLGGEGNPLRFISTVEQEAILQDAIGQGKRRMVEDQHVHVISAQLMPDLGHQRQTFFKSLISSHLVC